MNGGTRVIETEFHGAKAAVFIGDDFLIYQRDRGVPWPGYWDFPGGGREGNERPRACLRREVFEEFGIDVPDAAFIWGRAVPSMTGSDQVAWFFVVRLPRKSENAIRFGDEGQRWALMPRHDVANMPNLVPALHDRLSLWLRDAATDSNYMVNS